MSGNPFRRSLLPAASPSSNTSAAFHDPNVSFEQRFPVLDEVSSKPTSTKTKKVRITSPPRSPPQPSSPNPDSAFSRGPSTPYHTTFPSSSLPPESTAIQDDPDDPFNRDSDGESGSTDNEELRQNTQGNSGSLHSSSSQIPNPFQRTLATMEPSSQTTVDPQSNSRALGVKDKPPTAGRASMDVDSFKRLLLTGNANSTSMSTASTVMPHPKPQFGLTGDSSSSTDTSSVSRQSIFEPVHEPAQESPRTSYELDLSDDDERSQLVEVGPKVPKKKPPLPKHRHGKLVSSRAPQTVSFADFSPSYAPQRDHSPSATSRRTVTRKPSDLNKPLPPPPISPGIQTEDMSSISPPSPEEKRLNIEPSTPVSPENSLPTSIAAPPLSASQDQPNPTPPLIDSPMQTKKTPPPVPLSRRHSQLRSSNPLSNRSRSNSTLTTSSLDGPPTRPDSIAEVTSPTSAFIPSPPPTIPRSIAETATPVQSTTTFAPPLTASLSTSTPSLVRAPSITESTSSRSKPPPPPPARRHRSASKTEQQASSAGPAAAASWSNSQLVLNSTQGAGAMSPPTSPQQTFQGVIRSPSVRSSMGPPPPPPPKRSSAKSSFEAQRPGLAELRRASTVSGTEGREEGLAGSEVRAGEGTSGSGGGVDILGDMEAFQREIDELRDRYRRGS